MSFNNFKNCLDIILSFEGGYVNHREDDGGATNFGITISTLSLYLDRQATVNDVKNISMQTVEDIYRKNYWNVINGEKLPYGIDLLVFDFAVLSGTNRASRYLQQVVEAKVDGDIGQKTLQAMDNFIGTYGKATLVRLYEAKKINHFESLSDFKHFGKGWMRRNGKIVKHILDTI